METKNVSEIRLENAKVLLERFKEYLWARWPREPERGMMTRFARIIPPKTGDDDTDSSRYMSHAWNGRKQIGHELARRIERGVRELGPEFDDVVDGWMDNDHSQITVTTPDEISLIKCFRSSPPETQRILIDIVRKIIAERGPENSA